MFYVIFAIFAFLIRIHANPLPQSSNELINARQHSTEATSDIFSLSPSSDLGITGNAEDQPPEGRVIAGNTLDETNTNLLSLGCTTDSSTDVLDENAVLRRSAAACPANVITPTRPIPPPPILPGPNPNPSRQKTPVDIPEKPKPAGDARCADHDGRPHHLKCGGPEIGVTTTLISMVVNCEKAALTTTTIPSRPPRYVFDPTDHFAEYCCQEFGDEDVIFLAAICTKLTLIPMPQITLKDFNAWVQQLRQHYIGQ